MCVALNKSLSVLLGVFFLALMTAWQGNSAVPNEEAGGSVSACACCKPNHSNCAMPACCARPTDNRSPLSQVVPPSAPGSEWQAIATPSLALVTLTRSTLDVAPALASFKTEAVPIFQRNCSFLI